MDEQIKIPDLSEPQPKAHLMSHEGHLAHRWHLWIACYAASMIYALLHKVVIPLSLKVLHTNRASYTHVPGDIFWIVLFGLGVHYRRRITPLVQFFAGATLAFAGIEILRAIFEKNQGWYTVSSFIASVPLTYCTFHLLTFARKIHKGLYVFLGALTLILLRIALSGLL